MALNLYEWILSPFDPDSSGMLSNSEEKRFYQKIFWEIR